MLKLFFPIIALILGISIILLPKMTYRLKGKGDNTKFSYLNCFPYEVVLNYTQRIVLLALGTLFVMFATQSYILTFIKCTNPMYYSGLFLELISLIVFLGILYFGLDYYKTHIVMSVIFFLTQIGADVLFFVAVMFKDYYPLEFNKVIGIIMGVIGLILLVLLFIPQLKKWMYMEKTEENGTTIYVRPKVCSLAVVEWIFFLTQLINMILLIVNYFVI